MRVLIIGGTGLISTAIVQQLLDRGDRVTLYNRGVTARRFEGDVEVIAGDRWKYAEFEREMQQRTFDAVIDMVAFAPENADSLLRAFSGRAGHLVVCSTVCVYGGPLTRSPATDDEPHRPVTKYGQNKSRIESTLLAANGQNGLKTTILRPSFTTGKGHTALGALYFDDSMADRARRGLPLIVHDDGRAPWAIAHVSDVARGFVNALGNDKAYGQAYHLTSDEHTTWGGVFAALQEAAGGKSPVVSIPTDWLYEVAPRRMVGVKFIYQYGSIFDNGKAARDLGFRTTVPLVETFRRQIAWSERAGTYRRADEEPLQDVLLDAFTRGQKPAPGQVHDFNPWGNEPES
ncbi:NAD-dependent epimerase/dehydratase family protein [Sorangium sp. So ce834]|uniref:NAD-dependent epimerase/dehydratase family protein n=1 Tax=Sorangium sp. So ce834 TaxID=3133321 RepID=UPI003F5F8565